jgi:putative phage-type endonuclease
MSGLTAEQQTFRRTGIGASESPCLVGLSPFGNPISVWAEKVGIEIRETTDAMDLGVILEEGVARLYARKTGHEVAHFGTLRHPRFPWMLATPDLAVFGERRLAQIKIVGAFMAHHWAAGVPGYVEVQVQHEMEVADADACDVVALIGGTDFRILPVERDREMGRDLVEVCEAFWTKHVLGNVMPDPDGSAIADAAIRARFQHSRPTLLSATDEAERYARVWLEADEHVRRAEKAQAIAEQQLKLIIGEHEGIEGEGFRATWRANKKGTRVFLCKRLGAESEEAA